jgi:spore maturation protein SpmB
LLERRALFSLDRYGPVEIDASKLQAPDASALEKAEALAAVTTRPSRWRQLVAAAIGGLVLVALIRHVSSAPASSSAFDVTRGLLSEWLLPLLILGIVTLGFGRQVKVYEAFIAAAKEGFQTVIAIIPFLVGVLVAVGMFRASGAMEFLVSALSPLLAPIGFPPEALPLALVRPLTGSGALGLVSDGLRAYGPDSFLGYLMSVMVGSTETTFYVLALYFGAVQVKALRHTLAACVVSDFAGPIGALVVCRVFFT